MHVSQHLPGSSEPRKSYGEGLHAVAKGETQVLTITRITIIIVTIIVIRVLIMWVRIDKV